MPIKIHRLIHSKTGFALVEVLMVILIVGFIALLIGNLPSSLKLTGTSNHQSIAKQVVSKQVDDLRLKTFDNLGNGTSNISDTRIATLPSGTGTITIADCPVSICPNSEKAKTVNIKVSWKESGKSMNVQVDTLISQGGLN